MNGRTREVILVTFVMSVSLLLFPEASGAAPIMDGRFPAPSPDGRHIAFSWVGDIWTVPADGGNADRVTIHEAYEGWPCWSEDGSSIAFASKRHGSFDIYCASAKGGEERRLTYHSARDIPIQWRGTEILFLSDRYAFRDGSYHVYRVSTDGGTPQLFIDYPVYTGTLAPDGERFAFVSRPTFYNQWWRRYYKGGGNLRIWIEDRQNETMERITTTEYNDLWPMWSGDAVWFVSERRGTKDIWKLSPGGEPEQVTSHSGRGVEFPGISLDGSVIAYECDREIWVLNTASGEYAPIEIHATGGSKVSDVQRRVFEGDVMEMAISPKGKEIAAVIHGKVVIIVPGGEGRRLTQFPGRESQIAWSPDGKAIAFISDRDGSEDIFVARVSDSDTCFSTSAHIDVAKITDLDEIVGRITWSPDGARIAYCTGSSVLMRDYTTGDLYTVKPDGKGRKLVAHGPLIRECSWSPDSRWIAFSRVTELPYFDIFIVSADGGECVNVSRSPEEDTEPMWSADGSAVAFLSERAGNVDIWSVPLLRSERTARSSGKDRVSVDIDFDEISSRAVQVTRTKGDDELAVLSPDGERYAFKSDCSGMSQLFTIGKDGTGLRALTAADPREIEWNRDGKEIFFLTDRGELRKIPVDGGEPASVGFRVAIDIHHAQDRVQVFDEAWRLLDTYFYDREFHGVDWRALRAQYRARAEACSMEDDLCDILFRMIGELNASHLYVYEREIPGEDQTGYLGCRIEQNQRGEYVITDVLPSGPCDIPGIAVTKGEVLLEIDGVALSPDTNYYSLLNHKVGKEVTLKLGQHPWGRGTRTVKVTPVPKRWGYLGLCYEYWVRQRRQLTDEWSDGRIGYCHIQWMGTDVFERFKQELFSEMLSKEALIIDIRDNPGGWPPQDIFDILLRERYCSFDIAGQEFSEPQRMWGKPTVLLTNRFGKSAAEMTFLAFQELELGQVVGGKTPGFVIGTEYVELLNGLGFKVPLQGIYSCEGANLENWSMEPDVYVENEPFEDGLWAQSDTQLKKAVEILLEEIE